MLQKLFNIPSTEKISIEEFSRDITVFSSATNVLNEISLFVNIFPISQNEELIKLFIYRNCSHIKYEQLTTIQINNNLKIN